KSKFNPAKDQCQTDKSATDEQTDKHDIISYGVNEGYGSNWQTYHYSKMKKVSDISRLYG
ncbi:hypothetical protein CHS0354_015866, partial [Potamilus streckersoni]